MTGQFHLIPFFSFRQLLICVTRISQAIAYFFKILNNRYLTARVYLTQKPCSHPETSLPPASRKSHVEESCEGTGGQSTEEIERDTTVYLVCWLLLTQCSAFSMIYTTFEQIKGLVLVFYLGCLGGIFYFLESSRKVGLPSSKSKSKKSWSWHQGHPTWHHQQSIQCPASLLTCLKLHSYKLLDSGNGSIPETHNVTKSRVWPLVST